MSLRLAALVWVLRAEPLFSLTSSSLDPELVLNHITLVEALSWNWNQFWKRAISASLFGLIAGFALGLCVSVWFELALKPSPETQLFLALTLTLVFALGIGLPSGFLGGLVGGLTDRVTMAKAF